MKGKDGTGARRETATQEKEKNKKPGCTFVQLLSFLREMEAVEIYLIGSSKWLLIGSCVIGKARGDVVRRLG